MCKVVVNDEDRAKMMFVAAGRQASDNNPGSAY